MCSGALEIYLLKIERGMKRNIFLFFLLILTVTSCAKHEKFIIEGFVPDQKFNESVVYLVASDAPVTKNVDSTYVKNNHFRFVVDADSTIVKILRIPFKYPYVIEDLVVIPETGTLRAELNGRSFGEGTPLNNILQQWKDEKQLYDSMQGSIFQGKDIRSLEKIVVDSMMIISNKLKDAYLSKSISLMDNNLNNGIGLLLFKVYYNQLSPGKREEVLRLTNGEYFRRDAQLKNMTH